MDIESIKKNTDILQVIGERTKLKWTTKNELSGPCPFCFGTDRFSVQPNHPDGGRWYCRHCGGNKWHSVIDYVMTRDGVDLVEAMRRLSGEIEPTSVVNLVPIAAPTITPAKNENDEFNRDKWQHSAQEFTRECIGYLWGDDGKDARENGIPFTAHVGETRGIQNVRDTLEHFSPKRFGHGVCSIEDPVLLEHLRKEQIHLEACPTCNVQTDCYDTYADHPIDRLYRAGISVGVNTDTHTISNVSLNEECQKLHYTFGWEKEDFYRCNVNALKAAFIPDEVREPLLEKLAAGYNQAI